MTISTQNRTAGPYAGTGGVVSYPFSFKIFKPSDLSVIKTQLSAGVDVELALNTDYAVVMNGNQDTTPGGNVVLTSPLAVGFTLTLTSRVEYLQPTDLTNQGGFYPKVINTALDRLTIVVQQVLGIAGRAIKIPLSDGAINTTLPGKEQRKGRVLAFDETTGAPVLGPNIMKGTGVPYIGETQPPTPFHGMRWYNPSEPATYIFYKDGDSGQWVEESARSVTGTFYSTSVSGLPDQVSSGDFVSVVSFYDGWAALADRPVGGGVFVWNPSVPKSSHNGINIVAPEAVKVWNGSQSTLSSFLDWAGTGLGCWVKQGTDFTVADAGAVLDGFTVNNNAVLKFASVFGRIVFPAGTCRLSNIAIDCGIVFNAGASLTVAAGETVTIKGSVDSPKQFVFKGEGSYVFTHDTDSGENSRQAHASWFGIVPTIKVDQAPAINKAFASFGNLRESVLDFDVGNYYLGSTAVVTRGGKVRGQGARRTVFNALSDGFTAFVTSGEACQFEACQFEPTVPTTERLFPWIDILHPNCVIEDVFAGRAFRSFTVRANNTRIKSVGSFFDIPASVGSSLIAIQSSNNTVDDVRLNTSSNNAQSFAVHIGADLGVAGTLSGNNINGVSGTAPSIMVCVDASYNIIARTSLSNLGSNSFQGANPECVVKTITNGTFNLEDLTINGVNANFRCLAGIVMEQNSSGTTFDINIDNVNVSGSSGDGIHFNRTNGFLNKVRIGGNVNIKDRPTPIRYTGSNITQIRVDPAVLPNTMPAYCYDYTIADDSVAVIDLRRSVFTGWLMVSVGVVQYGIYVVRATPTTPTLAPFGTPTANMSTATTALTGTTGTDGRFTVGVTDGVLYLENRLGSSQRVNAILMTGVL